MLEHKQSKKTTLKKKRKKKKKEVLRLDFDCSPQSNLFTIKQGSD